MTEYDRILKRLRMQDAPILAIPIGRFPEGFSQDAILATRRLAIKDARRTLLAGRPPRCLDCVDDVRLHRLYPDVFIAGYHQAYERLAAQQDDQHRLWEDGI